MLGVISTGVVEASCGNRIDVRSAKWILSVVSVVNNNCQVW